MKKTVDLTAKMASERYPGRWRPSNQGSKNEEK